MGFEQSFLAVAELVKNFRANENYYLSPEYQEVDVRRDFIDKFFTALGWDVAHDIQKNPYEQEVRVERLVQVAKAQKRADYSFYLSPNFRDVKFFVEAKKPARNLENADDFFQTVRYGWNASTPIAVLTDFEEFIILDCRFRPDIADILNAKIERFHYTDYTDEEKFRKIYHLFSHEAAADNSIEKYAEHLPKPKRKDKKKRIVKGAYQSIDEAFLAELDEIRESLAKSFKKNNEHLSGEELTEAVQRTIDRLVFIRFLEDKLIEPHHYLSEFGKRKTAWEDFLLTSRTLDAKYNGIVFKKHQLDTQSVIEPDDKTFSFICEELSHLNSPYDFDKIPIHILGSIYERFLGRIVNATSKRVTIEEKPEVRKAGGVYYTPQYIVNYIVDNTVGKLIDGKTPKQIAKMRFADIACGSGSFLITVFDKLLEHHKKWYQENPKQAEKDKCVFIDGAWRLTLLQKQKILLNNIYGVDIDQQAVEVTQLSLYLKLLEDETTATANDTWVLFKEKLLPNLSKNIVCGNSLIGTDILNSSALLPFTKGEDEGGVSELKLKPMDFENVFPEVMKAGGFDAVVGNPPYINAIQLSDLFGKNIKDYLKSKYESAKGTYDIYIPFFEKGLKLLRNNGLLGFITPNKYLSAPYGIAFRKFVTENYKLKTVIDYSAIKVFDKPSIYPIITIIENTGANGLYNFITEKISANSDSNRIFTISSETLSSTDEYLWGFILSENIEMISKILNKSKYLSNISDVNATSTAAEADEYSEYIKDGQKDKNHLPIVNTGTIDRYESLWGTSEFANKRKKYKNPVLDVRKISKNRKELYSTPKIIFAKIALRIECFIDEQGEYASINTNCVYNPNKDINLMSLVGILNSKLISFVYSEYFSGLRMSGGYFQFQAPQLRILPIVIPVGQTKDSIENFVQQIIESKKQLRQVKTESDKTYLQRKCERLDKEIDQLVYELYGLTEEEIRIVEGK